MLTVISGAITALWLGVLTSISPCPLAGNIAAISYLSRRIGSMRSVVLSGVLYTLGRMLTYIVLGFLLAISLFTIPGASNFLQKYMNRFLGPVLIIAGMILLDLMRIPVTGRGISETLRKQVEKTPVLGSGLLGIVFALSFCPVSAALFFGSLIPLILSYQGSYPVSIVYPSLYGIGTAVPVIFFALLLAFGMRTVGQAFARVSQFESWARRTTGIVFILVGIYLALKYIFGISLP